MQAGLKAMTPQQRVRRAVALTILSHVSALAGIRREYPDESAREHKLRLAGRYIDAETMKAAFEWPHD
jgi:hypothetical protein